MNKPTEPSGQTPPTVEDIMNRGGGSAGWLTGRRAWLIGSLVLLLLAVVYFTFGSGKGNKQPQYRTEPAVTGTLVVTVSASGNLEPTNKVDVGSELSGIVEAVFVDDNDQVEKGQLLARLDLSRLNDAVIQSKANLAAAEAQLLLAKATVAEVKAKWDRFQEVFRLSEGKVPSKFEMDTAEAELKRAKANEASAMASVEQVRAVLQTNETNLEKAHIRSPINGVVLSRLIEPGQTVAATFQAPVLFTLAEDLAKMQLQVDVDEADVGQVQAGQKAIFTVDAWPGRLFNATITRVGYGAEENEGVISYPTVLEVTNKDLSLRPGMTGTAEITTLVRDNALLVPNAALRFTPPDRTVDTQSSSSSIMGNLMPRRPSRSTRNQGSEANGTTRQLWMLENGVPKALTVEVGASDGRLTEITSGDLAKGTNVITEALSNGS